MQAFSPDKTCVLVVDKQNSYADPEILGKRNRSLSDQMSAVVKNIDGFIETSRSLGVQVIWTQMTEDIAYSPAPIAEKMTFDQQRGDPLIESAPGKSGFEFFGKTIPSPEEKVILKNHYSAFAQTNLKETLEEYGITSLIVVGGFASRCILATAFGANSNDLRVIVPEDLVFVVEQDDNELAPALKIIDSILGYTLTSKAIIDYWSSLR